MSATSSMTRRDGVRSAMATSRDRVSFRNDSGLISPARILALSSPASS
jgi:hypothetical protein